MKHVLITGARGFVGASMIEHFLEHTEYVMYYTKRPPKDDDRLNTINRMNRVFEWKGEDIDIILHAAGNPSSLACIENPIGAIEDNISETMRTLEIARKYKVEHFIYFSSVEVYGKSGKCFEDDICNAQNMYAATKHSGEQICKAYQSSYGVPCSIVRLNNTFGHFCQKERFPMIAIRKLLNGEKFTIYTHDDEVVGRRWTSIYDVAEMVCFILEQEPGKIYNTTGDFMSNLQFLECIANAMNIDGFDYELIEENVRGRIGNQDAPPDFIRSLGWKSSKSFEERIREFVSSTLASS
jgi:nucleoside-diphosphate-sugar epimerase